VAEYLGGVADAARAEAGGDEAGLPLVDRQRVDRRQGRPPGRVHRDLADSDQLYLRVVARYDIKPLNAAGVYIITTA
jgi:hypothetical protein